MSLSRFNALDTIGNRFGDMEYVDMPTEKIKDFYGENVFGDAAMKQYLDEATYLSVKAAIQGGTKLSREVASLVATAMMNWAQDKGTTHFTHWFQPWTGKTAEKHDSFFTLTYDGKVIEEFSSDALVQQEPDGSSFPSGGMRATFEARGYTAWDPSSPAFIFDAGSGKTLCIPTVFITYTGDAMDYKLPLLKSQDYLNKAAVPVAQLFDPAATKVTATLGWEQEYFLVDEAFYTLRPDLILTGRTLVGKLPAKHQNLEDHYFGSIPERIYAFMRDLETEAHKLSIPLRTRHNEVGPAQYEFAPMFEEINVAVDHNNLLMDLMERVARRHKLVVLFHEKPFAGVNGSGKHNNWSIATNTGKNLLAPGKEPGKNLMFLTFFVNTIRAVYEYADFIRASIATANNDHRLGANEAPPAIISAFLGGTMDKLLNDLEKKGASDASGIKEALDLVSKIPFLEKDSTDRNRTSPFAFTGNKFEIRAVGSSQNCGGPMTVMNTIVAAQLEKFKAEVDKLIADGKEQDAAVLSILARYIKESKKVRFEGNGYSQEWKDEAAKRGLNNFTTTPEALKAWGNKKAEVFIKAGVYSKKELHAFQEVQFHSYMTKVQIESRTLGEMVANLILPAAAGYQKKLADSIVSLKAIGLDESVYSEQLELVKALGTAINGAAAGVKAMTTARRAANELEDVEEQAVAYCENVKPLMEEIRTYCDRLEYLVEDSAWPLPKYREMFYIR
ncbi:MAG: glutamine synthetase III [Saprospiraceae bacterium]|nr:glutamine synthetase III [Saprospiraceae bacterium]